MSGAYIVDAVRTAMGRRGGIFKDLRPEDLTAPLIQALVERNGIEPSDVEDVILGCVTQVQEQGVNVARQCALVAHLPADTPATTINRLCASGLQALSFACAVVEQGWHDLVITGGVESMSRVPMGSDAGAMHEDLQERFHLVPQGISAEYIAERWGLGREQLDEFSLESHQRAAAATDAGSFEAEIVPVTVTGNDGERKALVDETIRRNTSMEKLGKLRPAFKSDGVITAGNSSQITDGAATLLIASEEAVRRHGLRPRARLVRTTVAGVEPTIMLTAPIPATRKVLEGCGLGLEEMAIVELNEAFSSVAAACSTELGIDPARLNVNGGAIALGHPLGCTGARLVTSAMYELERRAERYALVTLCVGMGQGIASVIERVEG